MYSVFYFSMFTFLSSERLWLQGVGLTANQALLRSAFFPFSRGNSSASREGISSSITKLARTCMSPGREESAMSGVPVRGQDAGSLGF